MKYTEVSELSGIGFSTKISLLEKKLQLDPYTYKHSLNVASYVVNFIKYISFDMNEDLAYYSGLFHDIGKTEVERKVLYKVMPLTNGEFCTIKTHTDLGYKILLSQNLHDEILSAALYHHERFDGLGYPYGVTGNDIPYIARIISICDVFDALTMDRPYRKSYSVNNAIEIMKNSKGQFDSDLLPRFLNFINGLYYENVLKTSYSAKKIFEV